MSDRFTPGEFTDGNYIPLDFSWCDVVHDSLSLWEIERPRLDREDREWTRQQEALHAKRVTCDPEPCEGCHPRLLELFPIRMGTNEWLGADGKPRYCQFCNTRQTWNEYQGQWECVSGWGACAPHPALTVGERQR